MITALIFDCYGVLTTDGWQPFKDKYFANNPEAFDEASQLNQQTNAGLISYHDFLESVGELAGLTPQAVQHEIERNVANDALFKLIAELKSSYKIGILSNMAVNWLDKLFEAEQLALFDETALSYEFGSIKPEARAYEVIAERLGVEPKECVFIDDQERFCTAAKEVGMHAVQYQDVPKLRQALADLGVQS